LKRSPNIITKKIKCLGCNHEGRIDVGTSAATTASGIFEYLGHNPHTGDYYVRCPACGIDLSVNTIESSTPHRMTGFPSSFDPAIPDNLNETSSLAAWWVPVWWTTYIVSFLFVLSLSLILIF